MNEMNSIVVTTVNTIGEAESAYDIASFTLSIISDGASIPEVKERAKKKITALKQAVEAILAVHNVEVIKNSVQDNTNIQAKMDWINNRNVQNGYQAIYTLSFQTDTMDKVNNLYDDLSSLHEIIINMPVLTLKNVDKLNKKALKNAWKKASETFIDECLIFGLDPTNFEILSWNISYAGMQKNAYGKKSIGQATLRPAADIYLEDEAMPYDETQAIQEVQAIPANPINVVAGNTKTQVILNVSFKKKD